MDESFSTHIDIETPASSLEWADFMSGFGGIYINYEFHDSLCDCGINHKFKIYVEFTARTPNWKNGKYTCYLEQVEDIMPLASETMDIASDFLILRGDEILNIILFLFERWTALRYQIEIFCPYLTIGTCWNPLLETVAKFSSKYYDVNPIHIYTRKMQNFGRRTIAQQVTQWINQERRRTRCYDLILDDFPQCEENPFFRCIHNFGREITSNIYHTATPFHGKYYAGIDSKNRNAEIVSTSFNLVPFELKQYETFKLLKVNEVDFNTIRPNLNWEQVILNDDLFKLE